VRGLAGSLRQQAARDVRLLGAELIERVRRFIRGVREKVLAVLSAQGEGSLGRRCGSKRCETCDCWGAELIERVRRFIRVFKRKALPGGGARTPRFATSDLSVKIRIRSCGRSVEPAHHDGSLGQGFDHVLDAGHLVSA
jgi:hypothetical protein